MAERPDPGEAPLDSAEPEGEEEEEEGEGEGKTKVETVAPTKSAKKKKRGRKKGGGGAGPISITAESGPGVANLSARSLQEMLQKLTTEDTKKSHDFWDTQPVPKITEDVTEMGPMEPDRDLIRDEPLSLPDKFVWDEIDLSDDAQVTELYTLLNENYVEDDDNMFRFDYSITFLRWALHPPGWKPQWHCGVRVQTNRKLVGFISAVPAHVRIKDHIQLMVEINFLCVHKKLRSRRVAPVLIKEITRRVNQEGIFQAVYTAGILLPKPVAVCRYWHRSLNPKKLVDVQFTSIQRHMTLQRMIRLYRLPETTKTPGLRPIERRDMASVLRLFNEYMQRFDLAPVFKSEAEIAYWFLPKDGIINCYVVENPESLEVTDMLSFYHLPSTVVNHPVHKHLRVTYSFYTISLATPLKLLMQDALILAKQVGSDVFNALDVMENSSILEELKFGKGDGNLHYYFYNWKCPELAPEKVAIVLQ